MTKLLRLSLAVLLVAGVVTVGVMTLPTAVALVFVRGLPPLVGFAFVALLLTEGLADKRLDALAFGLLISLLYAIVVALLATVLSDDTGTATIATLLGSIVVLAPATILGGALAALTTPARTTLVYGYIGFALLLALALIGFSTVPILLLTPAIVAYLAARSAFNRPRKPENPEHKTTRLQAVLQGTLAAFISGGVYAVALAYTSQLLLCEGSDSITACIVNAVNRDAALAYLLLALHWLPPTLVGFIGAGLGAIFTERRTA